MNFDILKYIHSIYGVIFLNIAICDDNQDFRTFLEDSLRNYFYEKSISLNIFQFKSGEELLANKLLFDLIFLDVEMENINGIETGKELKKRNPRNIIFVITSYNGYLDDAFKINAFRFLSKPLDVARLYKALDDANDLLKNDIIVFNDMNTGEDIRIYTNDIILLEIDGRKTKVITVNGTYLSKDKITDWKLRLNGISFVSPHSSYIVNLDHSIRHTRTELILAKKDLDGNILERYSVAIAPKKQAEIKKAFFYVLERR